jgi:hypothetical protein
MNWTPRLELLPAIGILIAFLAVLAWWRSDGRNRQKSKPDIQLPAAKIDLPRPDRRVWFHEHLEPLIVQQTAASRASAERCTERIREIFQGYHRGLDPFVRDITSTWTRLSLLRQMPGAWWSQDDRMERFVRAKWEQHLFSEEKLKKDLAGALQQFQEDLQADQARMLSQVKVAVSIGDFPELEVPGQPEFQGEITKQFSRYATGRAEDSVYRGLTTLISSEVAFAVASSLVARGAAMLGASAMASTTAAGGATAGGAAMGAGGGSVAGPVGTAIGLVIGLAAGVAVDWWMTHQFQDQLRDELSTYLTRLQTVILRGSGDQLGLQDQLDDWLHDLEEVQRNVLREKILGESQ